MRSVRRLVAMWIAGIVLAILPLIIEYVNRGLGQETSWLLTIIHGELVLITVAILADVLVRAVASDDRWEIRFWLGLPALVVLIILTSAVGNISLRTEDVTKALTDTHLVSAIQTISKWGFLSSVVLSFAAVLILEEG